VQSANSKAKDRPSETAPAKKLAEFNQRVERKILSAINKVDKSTLSDIYQVSEYCAAI